MIKYVFPADWIAYDPVQIAGPLAEAKAAVMALQMMPYQRHWLDALGPIQYKREIAGTSRIEGADFTDEELDIALRESPEELRTRSQRQARSAALTYKWISDLSRDRRVDGKLIREIHRRMISGADDDHAPPGVLRSADQNVNFGSPRHRGVEGGEQCERAFEQFTEAVKLEYPAHDPLVQALAMHYHLAAMHPFLDGNGRTARALEALVLQRSGVHDVIFIPMSNFYYDEKINYLEKLAAARANNHDLTPFLVFALRGIAVQTQRVLMEVRHEVAKALFKDQMYALFKRLRSPRKRMIAQRQIEILKLLLEDDIEWVELQGRVAHHYNNLKNPLRALIRDINNLSNLGALNVSKVGEQDFELRINLDWPAEITESEFYKRIEELPKAKSNPFL